MDFVPEESALAVETIEVDRDTMVRTALKTRSDKTVLHLLIFI
jgi:hypothetical protein